MVYELAPSGRIYHIYIAPLYPFFNRSFALPTTHQGTTEGAMSSTPVLRLAAWRTRASPSGNGYSYPPGEACCMCFVARA